MKKYILILGMALSLLACSSEEELDRTIFIPDPADSSLPAYTEMGYNSFGVKYERKYFTASFDEIPCKIIYENGSLSVTMTGFVDNDYKKSMLKFVFPVSVAMNDYSDLLTLNNVKLDLTDPDCVVTFTREETSTDTLDIRNGELHFKRAQLLYVNDVENRVILSGTFYIQFFNYSTHQPESFSDGRFDFGINKDFYAF
ncbi:MAG: hypothetical protein LBR17_03880 [Bacteroidales bacterium]|jgi:hypothetical protein|nr:hypothetical protein [Bacteroidales bacterium]